MRGLSVALGASLLMAASPVLGQELHDEPGAAAVRPRPTSRPASRPAVPTPAPARTEYRFDALRVDGHLHGPETLVVRSMTGGKSAPLMRVRRSFVHRIFETLEDASLHGGR